MRNLFLLSVVVCSLVPTIVNGQLFTPYLFGDELEEAQQIARDSIGSDAVLVSGFTTGEIDLSNIGFPTAIPGFDVLSGKSPAWAYSFYSPSTLEYYSIVIASPAIGARQIFVEPGLPIGFFPGVDLLDLSGQVTDSDVFMTVLLNDPVFQQYRADFPNSVPTTVLLFHPGSDDEEFFELLEAVAPSKTLPLGHSYWIIDYYGYDFDGVTTDSSFACIVSATDGTTLCLPGGIESGVDDEVASQNPEYQLTVYPNPASNTVYVVMPDHTRSIASVGIYNLLGEEVFLGYEAEDNSGVTQRDGLLKLDLNGIRSGLYYCRVVDIDGLTHTSSFVVQ